MDRFDFPAIRRRPDGSINTDSYAARAAAARAAAVRRLICAALARLAWPLRRGIAATDPRAG